MVEAQDNQDKVKEAGEAQGGEKKLLLDEETGEMVSKK